MRPCASVAGTRCTRCVPDSNFSRAKAPRPTTRLMISRYPPCSPGFSLRTSTERPFDSAYRAYILKRSPAKMAASSPPVPARTSRNMFLSSRSSFGIRSPERTASSEAMLSWTRVTSSSPRRRMSASGSLLISRAAARSASRLRKAPKRSARDCSREYSIDRSRNCCEPPATSGAASSRPTSSKRSDIFSRRWRMVSFIGPALSGCPMAVTRSVPCGQPPDVAIVGRVKLLSFALFVSGGLAAASSLAAGRLAAAETSKDPNASTVIAEIALERGDCRAASEAYAVAAQRGDASIARRSTEVSLGCEHIPAAWDSVKRWRALAPADRDAAAVYATVALKLYRVPEARSAVTALLKMPPEDAAKSGGQESDQESGQESGKD